MANRVAPYRYLAAVYDGGWSDYAEYIYELIGEIESESGRVFSTVCDAACGTGILLGDLAIDDVDRRLYGYDRSEEMLQLAGIRAPSATVEIGDLRSPPEFGVPFELITCVYDSLNYLTTEEELRSFFVASRRAIHRDGLLLVDLNARALYHDRDGATQTRLIDGVPIRERFFYREGPPPEATTVFSFDEGEEVHTQRPWDLDEIENILGGSGWNLIDSLDVMDDETDEASGKIVYLAVPVD